MKYSKILLITLVVLLLVFLPSEEILAQCSMCKKTAEDGGRAGGINAAILFLAACPYVLIGSVAYFWYRNNKKNKAARTTEAKA